MLFTKDHGTNMKIIATPTWKISKTWTTFLSIFWVTTLMNLQSCLAPWLTTKTNKMDNEKIVTISKENNSKELEPVRVWDRVMSCMEAIPVFITSDIDSIYSKDDVDVNLDWNLDWSIPPNCPVEVEKVLIWSWAQRIAQIRFYSLEAHDYKPKKWEKEKDQKEIKRRYIWIDDVDIEIKKNPQLFWKITKQGKISKDAYHKWLEEGDRRPYLWGWDVTYKERDRVYAPTNRNGFDCTGYLYDILAKKCPKDSIDISWLTEAEIKDTLKTLLVLGRDTDQILHEWSELDVQGKTPEELEALLQEGDVIIRYGHIMYVYEQKEENETTSKRIIESRYDRGWWPGGYLKSPLRDVIKKELDKDKEFVNQSNYVKSKADYDKDRDNNDKPMTIVRLNIFEK